MEISHSLVAHATTLAVRSGSSSSTSERPPAYKAVGIALAVSSGVFIGTSFVLKKTGLLKANVKYNEEAGEGYGYLKNFWWWSGMILMIVGEICNFVAYAFVDAILVTPLGALSVVITTILSAIFLKERLSFVGKVGCFSCIIGSVVIALNAPEQSSVSDIQDMKHYVIAPGFLSYAGVVIVGCAVVALWLGPRYGKKSMFVYISICSLIGGLSVVATQGLGAAILAQINGKSQFKEWFLYVLLVFVIGTLLTEIIYLNKALNLFNAALVTPTYYVFFTSSTIVSSAILFQGFKGTGMQIATVILGFLQICAGVVLLQLSKSAKDVPDAAVFKGDLDQIREVAAQEEPETEPKADSIRGAAAIIRRISTARRRMEEEEARRYIRDKQEDYLKPPAENEIIEWDGLRRRKTVLGQGPTMARPRTSSSYSHPPLGMSESPDDNDPNRRPSTRQSDHSFLDDLRSRASNIMHPGQWHQVYNPQDGHADPVHLTVSPVHGTKTSDTSYHGAGMREVSGQTDTSRSIAWADETPDREASLHSAKRQFSFNTVFNRIRSKSESEPPKPPPHSPRSILRRSHLVPGAERQAMKGATEEERLGLVKGDSRAPGGEDWDMHEKLERIDSSSSESISNSPEPYGSSMVYGHGTYDYGYAAQTSPTEMQSGWQLPSTRSVTTTADPGGSTPSSSRSRANPLPPLPDEAPFIAGEDSHMRVELRSPTSPSGTDDRGWRRPASGHGDSPSSMNRGAFI
ncbi:magnesium transporter NIPA2 [Aspergillus udagawae]|nr:magnesium transporter NIPA2 [Aspergillus udagawae]